MALCDAPLQSELEPLREFAVETCAQALLKFVLSDCRVSCAIPATSSPDQMREDGTAGEPPWFVDEERRYGADAPLRPDDPPGQVGHVPPLEVNGDLAPLVTTLYTK